MTLEQTNYITMGPTMNFESHSQHFGINNGCHWQWQKKDCGVFPTQKKKKVT